MTSTFFQPGRGPLEGNPLGLDPQSLEVQKRMMQAEALRSQAPSQAGAPAIAPQGQLSEAQLKQLTALERYQSPAAKSIMSAGSPTWGTALAKTLAAGMIRGRDKKKTDKGVKERRVSFQKLADKEAREERRLRGREDVVDAREVEEHSAMLTQLGLDQDAAKREEEVHADRNITDTQYEYEATLGADDPFRQRDTAAYGQGYAKFLEEQETRYGTRTSGGGYIGRARQEMDGWDALHPDASLTDQQDKYEEILNRHKIFEQNKVQRKYADPEKPVVGGTTTDVQNELVDLEAQIAGAKKTATLVAEKAHGNQQEYVSMKEQEDVFGRLIADENFDDAVGPMDAYFGRIGADYFGTEEGVLGDTVEREVNLMVAKTAQYFPGNLNQEEIRILRGNVPSREKSEESWKAWYEDYKRAVDRMQARVAGHIVAVPGDGGMGVVVPGNKPEPIRID